MMQLPLQYVENMKLLLGEKEWEAYLASFSEKHYGGLRFNLLKCSLIQPKLPFELAPVPWCEEGRLFLQEERPAKHPYYAAGLYYLQEPSAMSSAAFLPVEKGDRVLDLCAAPGGKATQLGARLQNTGLLVANDISTARSKALLKNIEQFGIRNAIVLSEQPKRIAERLPNFFDKILIDAPCSGEGMFRRDSSMVKSWNEELISFCKEQQKDLLIQGAKLLQAGGMLLYSTCTFAPAENEQTILEFLKEYTDFEVIPIPKSHGMQDGIPQNETSDFLKGCVRFYPHKLNGEGHFVALLKHNAQKNEKATCEWEFGDKNAKLAEFDLFSKEVLKSSPEGIFKLYGDSLCLLPNETPVLKGLRVLRTGWQIGNFQKGRFEPSQAFAMGLKWEDVKNVVSFPLSDDRVIRYLKGETVEVEQKKNGWHVVFVEQYPLGFGKVQNGRLKNKYPPSWKWE